MAAIALVLGAPPPSGAAGASSGTWIYLRGGEAPTAAERLVEVLAVGDVMTGRGLAGRPDLFGDVAAALRAADLAIGNLEGAIVAGSAETGWDGGGPPAWSLSGAQAVEPIRLLLPLGTPATLAEAGFDLLSLANNHTLDAGPAGLSETHRLLQAAGLEPVEAGRPVTRTIDGLRLAILAWNDIGAPDHEALMAAIAEARAAADIVLVLAHWGQEYQRHPRLPQRELAAELHEAGADAVLGSHPHVVQDLQLVQPTESGGRARLVAYSLGNFAFDQGWDDTAQGLALRLFFDAQGLRAVQARPLWTAPRPRWMDADSAAPLLARVLPHHRLGFTCSEESCEPTAVPQDSRSGLLGSGAIDLSGDGVPEIVRRQGDIVEILQDGRLAWRSPAEWQVRDFALGDPNHDGRYEALLAVDKPEGTSQPFIIGYRGGTYHDLWGGSPVHAPILEVELGDLDGDGLEELAVIEAAPDGSARFLTLWRWHGWGFSLVWRSPPGEYHDLVVLPPEDGRPCRLSVAVR
jgi:poly-gamma-glutamate synthesis protein (capsule biosynthesis protein)